MYFLSFLSKEVPDLTSTSLSCRSRPALNFNDIRMRSAVQMHTGGFLHSFTTIHVDIYDPIDTNRTSPLSPFMRLRRITTVRLALRP